jgi:cytochrome c oxidase subunit 2
MKKLFAFCLTFFWTFTSVAGAAFAFEPKPASIGLQPPASPNMEHLVSFHDDLLLWIITGIVIFVFLLLVWVVLRFNKTANPEPSKTTHNVLLEVVWTAVPVIILIIIAVPSFKLLFFLDRAEQTDMTLKVSGYQWGWAYSYPDQEIEEYRADIILGKTEEETAKELAAYIPDNKGRRLLETYNPVVLPVDKNIEIITTATDVIHSWAVPAFGVKKDSVPGRANSTWVRIEKPGIYYGQCSEICGINHAYMPISVYAVTEGEFNNWVSCVKENDNADYPARTCVQSLGLDKYRSEQKPSKLVQIDG